LQQKYILSKDFKSALAEKSFAVFCSPSAALCVKKIQNESTDCKSALAEEKLSPMP